MTHKLLQYVSFKLISILKITEEGGFNIYNGEAGYSQQIQNQNVPTSPDRFKAYSQAMDENEYVSVNDQQRQAEKAEK